MRWGLRFFYEDESFSEVIIIKTLSASVERIKQEERTSKKAIVSITTWDMDKNLA